jgi:hypothetical protein
VGLPAIVSRRLASWTQFISITSMTEAEEREAIGLSSCSLRDAHIRPGHLVREERGLHLRCLEEELWILRAPFS